MAGRAKPAKRLRGVIQRYCHMTSESFLKSATLSIGGSGLSLKRSQPMWANQKPLVMS